MYKYLTFELHYESAILLSHACFVEDLQVLLPIHLGFSSIADY